MHFKDENNNGEVVTCDLNAYSHQNDHSQFIHHEEQNNMNDVNAQKEETFYNLS